MPSATSPREEQERICRFRGNNPHPDKSRFVSNLAQIPLSLFTNRQAIPSATIVGSGTIHRLQNVTATAWCWAPGLASWEKLPVWCWAITSENGESSSRWSCKLALGWGSCSSASSTGRRSGKLYYRFVLPLAQIGISSNSDGNEILNAVLIDAWGEESFGRGVEELLLERKLIRGSMRSCKVTWKAIYVSRRSMKI